MMSEVLTQRPVAWMFELANYYNIKTKEYSNFMPPQLSFTKPCVPEGSIRNLTPLYAPIKANKDDPDE